MTEERKPIELGTEERCTCALNIAKFYKIVEVIHMLSMQDDPVQWQEAMAREILDYNP